MKVSSINDFGFREIFLLFFALFTLLQYDLLENVESYHCATIRSSVDSSPPCPQYVCAEVLSVTVWHDLEAQTIDSRRPSPKNTMEKTKFRLDFK